MKTLLRPYEGTLPYLFVSYAHKNDAAVLEIISTLQSRGFRVWKSTALYCIHIIWQINFF